MSRERLQQNDLQLFPRDGHGDRFDIAVKYLVEDADNRLRSLQSEVDNAQRLPYFVRLLGCCLRPPALVFEYMEGGDLQVAM